MKNKAITTQAILAAIMGLSQFAHADGEAKKFTPIECLSPEVRQEIGSQVFELTKDIDIDWDKIAVGINENGKISFRRRSDVPSPVAGSFSCAASSIAPEKK